MITIKKKKIKLIARILALIGVLCVIFVTFALPAFAWGNPVPEGNASNAGVYSMTPLYNVKFHRFTESGNNLESTYSTNNYLNLNNRSGYTPSFPQVQSNGVSKTTVNQSFFDDAFYIAETEFDPAYYGEGTRGYLSLEAHDVFLFTDSKSCSLKDNIGESVYEFFSYFYTYDEAHDPDFTFDPDVIYGCTYFYVDGSSTVVSEQFHNNTKMQKHRDPDGRNIYYLYEDIIENAPVDNLVDLKYVYVDYLYVNSKLNNLDLTYPVGYGCNYYNGCDVESTIDFQALIKDIADTDGLQSKIDYLEEQCQSLQREYDYYYSEAEWLRSENAELTAKKDEWESKYYDSTVQIAGLREENQALEKKNFELRNTTGAIDEYFTGISSALWDGLNEISQIGYSYVDSNGVMQTITVGSLITITVIGVVAFFVIKLVRW